MKGGRRGGTLRGGGGGGVGNRGGRERVYRVVQPISSSRLIQYPKSMFLEYIQLHSE